jgi:hypothetical protein
MPDHDPTRTDRLALYMRARAAEKAAHDDAVAVIERWNTALGEARRAVVADDLMRGRGRNGVVRGVLHVQAK